MSNYHARLTLLLLFFLKIGFLDAQYTRMVCPANIFEVADEIEELFGTQIDIPANAVTEFLTDAVFESNCQSTGEESVTLLNVTGVTESSIEYNWEGNSISTLYRYGYLNLKSGEYHINFTTAYDAKWQDINPGGTILFFKAGVGGDATPAVIGVVDLIMVLAEDPDAPCDCGEKSPTTLTNISTTNTNPISVDWNNDGCAKNLYQVTIRQNNQEVSKFAFQVNHATQQVNYNDCLFDGVDLVETPDHYLLESLVMSDLKMRIYTHGLQFQSSSNDDYDIEITYCCMDDKNKNIDTNTPNENNDNATVYPQFNLNKLQIIHDLPINTPVSVELFDLSGQLILAKQIQQDMLGEIRTELDKRVLPSGLYFCVIKTSYSYDSFKLIKQ